MTKIIKVENPISIMYMALLLYTIYIILSFYNYTNLSTLLLFYSIIIFSCVRIKVIEEN